MARRTQKQQAVFWDVHSSLPREGPGSAETTKRALQLAAPIPRSANVLDIASGPGAQTIDLACLLPEATIWAIDTHQPFVEETNRRAAALGVGHRVKALTGDMRSLQFPHSTFDLVWCEGAAYFMGVENALRVWKPMLRPGGRLALSEVVWLSSNPPDKALHIWSDYPAMADVRHWRDVVRANGYELFGDFVLPHADWWEYYTPMQERLRILAPKYAGDADAEAILKGCADEIAAYRDHGMHFGYVFLVMGLSD